MVKLYDFDGEQLSAGQIAKRYPAYSPSTLALACGGPDQCKSLADLQARDARGKANVRKAAKDNAARMPKLCTTSDRRRKTYKRDLNGMGLRS